MGKTIKHLIGWIEKQYFQKCFSCSSIYKCDDLSEKLSSLKLSCINLRKTDYKTEWPLKSGDRTFLFLYVKMRQKENQTNRELTTF